MERIGAASIQFRSELPRYLARERRRLWLDARPRSYLTTRAMSSKPSLATSTPLQGSSDAMVAVKTNCRVWLQVAGPLFLLLASMLVGQDASNPPPGPPSPSTATTESSPSLNSSQPGVKSATTQNAWAFSK